jgi:hypothetical protein
MSIHSPGAWSNSAGWYNRARADVSYADEAVSVLLYLSECRSEDPGAARTNDPSREVRITLDESLAGRVVIDGVHGLVVPEGPLVRRSDPTRWQRVDRWDAKTLVVYWFGGASHPLDRIEAEFDEGALVITVLEQGAGRLAGMEKAAIVRLDEPVGDRVLRDGALGK